MPFDRSVDHRCVLKHVSAQAGRQRPSLLLLSCRWIRSVWPGTLRRIGVLIGASLILATALPAQNAVIACADGYTTTPYTAAAWTVMIRPDATVWRWGYNTGTGQNDLVPVAVSGLSNAIAVAAGKSHALVLKSDGSVWSMGVNNVGQLGDGTTTNRATPVQVTTLANIVAIAAGGTAWRCETMAWSLLGD